MISSRSILRDIPASFSEEQRLTIIRDYEKARVHLVGVFALKLAHWQEVPFAIFGLAHFDPQKSMA